MPFPFERDSRLNTMLSDHERVFQVNALRAQARESGFHRTRRPLGSLVANFVAAISARFRPAKRPIAPQEPVKASYPQEPADRYPANVVPIGKNRSLQPVPEVVHTVLCTCGCLDGA